MVAPAKSLTLRKLVFLELSPPDSQAILYSYLERELNNKKEMPFAKIKARIILSRNVFSFPE